MVLASIHNIRHLVRLVDAARRAILDGRFAAFYEQVTAKAWPGLAAVRSDER